MGVWELDRFKSVYDPITTAAERQILTIAGAGRQFKATTKTWRNSVANDITYTAAFDGKDYPTGAAGATVAFKHVNPTTVERTAKLFEKSPRRPRGRLAGRQVADHQAEGDGYDGHRIQQHPDLHEAS